MLASSKCNFYGAPSMLPRFLPSASKRLPASRTRSNPNLTAPFLASVTPNRQVLARAPALPSHDAAGCSALPQTATVAVAPAHPITRALTQLPPAEQALLLIGFILCTIVATTISFVVISLPTIFAAKRVLISLDKLSKIARTELPGTMASIRLSGIEINDLTHQLNRLRISLHDTPLGGQNKGKTSEVGKSNGSPIMD